MSKELLRRGFKFAGSTICYAFMQAVGIVNDHLVGCFRYSQLAHSSSTASIRGQTLSRSSVRPTPFISSSS